MRNAWDPVVCFLKLKALMGRQLATLALAGLVAISAGVLMTREAGAKTPGKTYCFLGVCHRVLTLAQTRARIGKRASVIASFYDDCVRDRFNPCGLTSSGTVFRPGKADNAASPIYPNGTKLLVFNPANGRAAVVRIDNAGPYWGRRTLDLSRAAADRLGFRKRGVARLVVKVLKAPTTSEARYRRKRRYEPVKGYLGSFADVKNALAAAGYGVGVRTEMPVAEDPSWARHAAMAAPVLPVLHEPQPAPLPVKPTPAFAVAIKKLAVAARRERVALERKRRAAAKRVALAKAKAEAAAEKQRQVAAAAQEKRAAQRKVVAQKASQPKRRVAVARPAQAAQPTAQARPAASVAPQQANATSRQLPQGEAKPASTRSRTVWRREVTSIAQNSS